MLWGVKQQGVQVSGRRCLVCGWATVFGLWMGDGVELRVGRRSTWDIGTLNVCDNGALLRPSSYLGDAILSCNYIPYYVYLPDRLSALTGLISDLAAI